MDIWEKMYLKAKEEYRPQEVTPFLYAHHVVCALESENGEIYTGFCVESCCGVMDLCAERGSSQYVCKQRTDRDQAADRIPGTRSPVKEEMTSLVSHAGSSSFSCLLEIRI